MKKADMWFSLKLGFRWSTSQWSWCHRNSIACPIQFCPFSIQFCGFKTSADEPYAKNQLYICLQCFQTILRKGFDLNLRHFHIACKRPYTPTCFTRTGSALLKQVNEFGNFHWSESSLNIANSDQYLKTDLRRKPTKRKVSARMCRKFCSITPSFAAR